MKRFEQLEHLIRELGTDTTLHELVNAMSDDQMQDLYEWVTNCYCIKREVE